MDPSKVIDGILADWPSITQSTEPTESPPVEPELPSEPAPEPPGPPEEPVPAPEPAAGGDDSDPETLLVPPGGPIWTDDELDAGSPPEPVKVKLSDGRELTAEEIETLLRSSLPAPAVQPQPQLPPEQGLLPPPTLPAFSEEDLDNPALRAVVLIAAAQQRELADMRAWQTQQAAQNQAAQGRYNAEIVNSATSAFQSTYNLPDDLMGKVSQKAASLLTPVVERQILEARSKGLDPNTVLNPYRAVSEALAEAYWTVPEGRRFEFERQTANREKTLARKARLNGVGGAAGATPRSAPPTGEPQSLYDSLVAEVATAMGMDQ